MQLKFQKQEIMDKVCLTTFIYGKKYQQYIPFLIYSINKAMPSYDVVVFVSGTLDNEVMSIIEGLDSLHYTIKENSFSDCPKMTPLMSQCLRWLLWDESFNEYDFVYTVDSDILYIYEPTELHKQHVQHMATTGLIFDNMKRLYERRIFNHIETLRRIKYAGFNKIFRYFFGTKIEFRASGLHFVDAKKYYNALTPEKINIFKTELYTGKWLNKCMFPNDEVYLFYILDNLGLKPSNMPTQSDSVNSLNFNKCSRPEFRPHHGIHLGIFRPQVNGYYNQSDLNILNSDTYKYYVDILISDYLKDDAFLFLLRKAPQSIRDSFERMFDYYGIEKSFLL